MEKVSNKPNVVELRKDISSKFRKLRDMKSKALDPNSVKNCLCQIFKKLQNLGAFKYKTFQNLKSEQLSVDEIVEKLIDAE